MEPKVSGSTYDAAERQQKIDAKQAERQKRFADMLRRTKLDLTLDKTSDSPEKLERDYRVGAVARLEAELSQAAVRNTGTPTTEDI